jgi:hypothetical protein
MPKTEEDKVLDSVKTKPKAKPKKKSTPKKKFLGGEVHAIQERYKNDHEVREKLLDSYLKNRRKL